MTLNEISYMILEGIRANNITDDDRLDMRLIKDWIDLKRAQYIKNQRNNNPNGRLNLNLYQSLPLELKVTDVTDAGDYPYASAKQEMQILESTTNIPPILEDKNGPVIYSIESEDLMKFAYSVVDYDYLRVAGNGKFNRSLIFAAIRDNKVYFKYNSNLEYYPKIVLKAIFESPRQVTGYDDETTRYPASLGLIEYIKNAIFEIDAKVALTMPTDESNDSSGDLT